MAPFFANQSCDPFLPESARCVLGTYVSYAVNASKASDYHSTIDFVQRFNLRLTIRNTGHDYNAKSSGAGAVAIWTHHMKSIEILDYNSISYTGKAMRMGAGVQAIEAYEAAHAQGLVVVGGNCPTVGIAGGYTQGGGHGPLASKFGLGADQVLEWEVVTGANEHLWASPTNNSDLYWALSGGGGGTFGVVLSVTTKAYSDMPSSASNLSFTNQGVSQEAYYEAIETFHGALIPLVDAGGVSVWQFTNTSFSMAPTYGPNISKAQMNSLLRPVKDKLDQLQMKYSMSTHLLTPAAVLSLISLNTNSICCRPVSNFPGQLQCHESSHSSLRPADRGPLDPTVVGTGQELRTYRCFSCYQRKRRRRSGSRT